MLKIALSLFIMLHGLLHLLGFVNEWHLSPVPQLTGKTTFPVSKGFAQVLGIFWLATALIFLLAAATLLLHKNWWWVATLAGIIFSETLIIIYWKDAKAGSVANMLLFALLIFYINRYF